MPTAHYENGFRFVIFFNDHGPAHIHVFGPDGEAKITLEGPEGLVLDWFVGIGRLEMRRIMQEAERERGRLLAEWRRIHG